MDFENKVPDWKAAGNEPPETLKESGFQAGYKPPAAYFNWFWSGVSACLTEIRNKLKSHAEDKNNPHGVTATQAGALPIEGGALSGPLTVIDNFNINKTYDGVEYKSYIRPINYSISSDGNYSTGLLHYNNGVNNAQLMFNKDGVMLRDNVAGKAYRLYGQHYRPTAADIGTIPLVESTEYPGCYYRTVDGVEEWLNPPMMVGVEYRLIERANGRIVYAKSIKVGYLAKGDHTISHTVDNLETPLSISTENQGYYLTTHVEGYYAIFSRESIVLKTAANQGDVYVKIKYTKFST